MQQLYGNIIRVLLIKQEGAVVKLNISKKNQDQCDENTVMIIYVSQIMLEVKK